MPAPNLADVSREYGEAYQADGTEPRRYEAWQSIASVLLTQVDDPKTVLDVGCGPGVLVEVFSGLGLEAWGIEGSIPALHKTDARILLWDLRVPLTILHPFDVVTCFDVGEHVGNAEALVETIAAATNGTLFFGAAPPGQDGHGHIDLREPGVWTEMFAAKGLSLDEDATAEVKATLQKTPGVNYLWWVEKNLHVYRNLW